MKSELIELAQQRYDLRLAHSRGELSDSVLNGMMRNVNKDIGTIIKKHIKSNGRETCKRRSYLTT